MNENYENMTVSEKMKKLFSLSESEFDAEGKYKINASNLLFNVKEECYRELMVSYLNMLPILEHQVSLEEADYILYMHMYARCEEYCEYVANELRRIADRRKDGAEIIVLGKATNAEKDLQDIPNITFYGDNFAYKLGQRFGYDIREKYIIYDDEKDFLAIWPVDGCLRKCKFCRRTFMNIRFQSQSLDFLKSELDFFKSNHPEQMRVVSLRAENLTEYGLDIYGKPMLHKVIDLIDSYEEVEKIQIDIGLCISEITPEILDSICRSRKINYIVLNLEAGNDKLLKTIGKGHTCEQAINICQRIRKSNPDVILCSTVLLGLPTESIGDVLDLSELISKATINRVLCNFYSLSTRHPLANLPQQTESCRMYHLKLFLKFLCEFDLSTPFSVLHWKVPNKPKSKKEILANKVINEYNKLLISHGMLPVHYVQETVYKRID